MLSFELINNDGRSRRGKLITPSGQVDTLTQVAAGQTVTVREGEGITARVPFSRGTERQ